MDLAEAASQARQRQQEDAARMKSAAKSPLASTGGKGFQRGTGVSEKANEYVPSAPKTAADMGGAQDTGDAPVAYGQDSLNYLGHMAGDNVTTEGHNNVPLTGQQGFGMIGSLSPLNDTRDYLGHMAGNDVTAIGHNPGVKGTLEEYKAGTLHSGSKTGPIVKNRKQAIAIGLSQERRGK
jgi:hypothetical protein